MPKPVIPTNAFAAGNSYFINSLVQKLQNSAKPNSGDCLPDFLWRDLAGFRIAGDLHSKPRKSLCDRIHLTFATVSRCLHSLRSVDMTAFASENSCFRNSHEQKRKNSAKQNSWIVCRFSLLPPLRPGFAKKNSVSLCKGTKLQTVCRGFVGESCRGFPLFLILLKVFPSLPERRCGSVQYFCHIL